MLADDGYGAARSEAGQESELLEDARQLAEGMPDGLLLVDALGYIIYANSRLLTMTGYAKQDLLGRAVELLVPTAMRSAHVRHREAMQAGPAFRPMGGNLEFRVQRADGSTFPADIGLSSMRLSGERVVVAVVSDQTRRKRLEELRTMQFTVTRILTEAAAIDDAAPRLLQIIGQTLEVEVGQLRLHQPGERPGAPGWSWYSAVVHNAGTEEFHARFGELRDELEPIVSFPIISEGAEVGGFEFYSWRQRRFEVQVEEILHDIGGQVGNFMERRRAEAELRESNARLAEIAATDPLTGIRNRREFERLLVTVPRRRFAVLALDLDNLKDINDEGGHEAGDAALRAVAATLVATLRGWDVVARIGGDEFAVLMSDVSARETARAAERIRAAVSGISLPHGQVRISIGWATGPAGADSRGILDLADGHLYEAKRGGRDRVVGAPMGRPGSLAARRSEWAAHLERVLAEGRVPMLFQPIVAFDDAAVVGHEALARPLGFGPTDSVEDLFREANRLGRIRDLDWLCRRAAISAVPWPMPADWTLFLNLNAAPLLDPVHGVDQLLMVLDAAGGRPEQVVLELTERDRIADLERVRQVMAAYREAGFRFALDDVGEGHSTLELLAAASPEYIKLARSLTMTASHSGSRAAVRAAVAFAQASGATVVAEGVENEFVAAQMVRMGVGLGQGMWLGRPGALDLEPKVAVRGIPRPAMFADLA